MNRIPRQGPKAHRCLHIGAPFFMVTVSTTEETKAILTMSKNGFKDPEQLKAFIETSLDADKAEDIETIDLRGQTALADYMIVASGRSSRQVSALAEKLSDRLRTRGVKQIRVEGTDQGNWVVLDAGDIIVHLFRPEVREFYNIEKMWRMPQLMEVPAAAHSL